MHHSGYRFEGDTEVNGLPIGDAALDASGAIRSRAHLAAFHPIGIVVLRAGEQNPAETRADFKTFGRRKT